MHVISEYDDATIRCPASTRGFRPATFFSVFVGGDLSLSTAVGFLSLSPALCKYFAAAIVVVHFPESLLGYCCGRKGKLLLGEW